MKNIFVPLSLGAMERLDTDDCLPGDLLELNLDEIEFEQLYHSGALKEINRRLGTIIDDYEDESVQGSENLAIMREIIESCISESEIPVLRKVLDATKEAISKGTGVYFYF